MTQRNYEIISVHGFKALNLGVIRYVARHNKFSKTGIPMFSINYILFSVINPNTKEQIEI